MLSKSAGESGFATLVREKRHSSFRQDGSLANESGTAVHCSTWQPHPWESANQLSLYDRRRWTGSITRAPQTSAAAMDFEERTFRNQAGTCWQPEKVLPDIA